MSDSLISFRSRFAKASAARDSALSLVVQEESALVDARQRLQDAQEAQKLTQEVAATVQRVAHERIARVVTRCLKAVFGEEGYEFRIDFEQKRGRTETRLVLVREELELDPLDSAGGGVVDVTAFALRLACLVLYRPRKRALLCLDEPFKYASKGYHKRIASLLLALAEELHIQIVMITHEDGLKIGTVIELD